MCIHMYIYIYIYITAYNVEFERRACRRSYTINAIAINIAIIAIINMSLLNTIIIVKCYRYCDNNHHMKFDRRACRRWPLLN